jgi:general secretion pathway protein K
MRHRRRSRGIALVLVLWVITLLTVMALGLTAAQRTESTLTANALDGARFRAAAEAGISYAVLNLLAPRTQDPANPQIDAAGQPNAWEPNGSSHPWIFAAVPLQISVQNESSRIDLNMADAGLLASLLRVLDVPDDAAAALADRIVDWRDPDDLVSLNGAEDPEYAAEGFPYGAKDAPFGSVEELRQVLGITAELYQRLAPELTVDVGANRPDEQFADAVVLAAVQGLTLPEAQQQVTDRSQPVLPGGQPRPQGVGGPLYRIRVVRAGVVDDQTTDQEAAAQAAGAGLAMEALVRVEQGGRPPVRVVWRRYGLAPPSPAVPTDETRDRGHGRAALVQRSPAAS